MSFLKILIIDDHSLFREGLSHVLNELTETVNILEASNYDYAMKHASQNLDLDLVLLDLSLPGKDGFTVQAVLSEKYPTVPVVIVSGSNLRSDVQRAMDHGAMGYIPKESTSQIMLNALKLILAGGIYFPPELLKDEPNKDMTDSYNSLGLTLRQRQVLALVVEGNSNKEIVRLLKLAEATVKMHVTAILKSLNVNNRTQAARVVEKLRIKLPLF